VVARHLPPEAPSDQSGARGFRVKKFSLKCKYSFLYKCYKYGNENNANVRYGWLDTEMQFRYKRDKSSSSNNLANNSMRGGISGYHRRIQIGSGKPRLTVAGEAHPRQCLRRIGYAMDT